MITAKKISRSHNLFIFFLENGGGGNESDATSACSFATACTSLVPSVTSAVVVAPSVIQEEQEEELFEEEDEETTRSPSPVRVPLQVKVVSFSNRDLLRGIQGLPLVRLRRCMIVMISCYQPHEFLIHFVLFFFGRYIF